MDFLFKQDSIKLFLIVFLALALLRFFLMITAGFFVIKRFATKDMKIQNKPYNKKIVLQEILYSILTMLIFTFGLLCVYLMYHLHINKIYTDPMHYGIIWLVVSPIVLLFLHDAYFYWMHRFMHLKKVFVHVHKVHHYSYNPNLWSSFSFHPFEAILEDLFFIVITLIIPLNPWVVLLFFMAMYVHVFYGHCGYEIPYLKNNRLTKYIITSTHHNMHHSKIKCNYGLYFTFWDKLCGTVHPEYDNVINGITKNSKDDQNNLN